MAERGFKPSKGKYIGNTYSTAFNNQRIEAGTLFKRINILTQTIDAGNLNNNGVSENVSTTFTTLYEAVACQIVPRKMFLLYGIEPDERQPTHTITCKNVPAVNDYQLNQLYLQYVYMDLVNGTESQIAINYKIVNYQDISQQNQIYVFECRVLGKNELTASKF